MKKVFIISLLICSICFNPLKAAELQVNLVSFGAVTDGTVDSSPAFTNALQALNVNGGTLIVPAGRYILNSVVTMQLSDAVNIKIKGAGVGATSIEVRNSVGGFQFSCPVSVGRLDMSDLSLRITRANNGISIQYNASISQNSKQNINFKNIEIRLIEEVAVNSNLFFNKSIYIDGAYKPMFDNVVISAAFGQVDALLWETGKLGAVAFELSNVYAPSFIDCYAWSQYRGYYIHDYKNYGSDRIWFDRSFAVGDYIGIDISNVSSSPIMVEEGHYNCNTIGIKLENVNNATVQTSAMYNVHITDYPNYNDILLLNCQNINVVDNIFNFNAHASRVGIAVQNASSNINVNRNKFTFTGTSVVSAAGCTNVNTDTNNYDATALPPVKN
jgi:hypothetical protein